MLLIGFDDEYQRFVEMKVACGSGEDNERFQNRIMELVKNDESLEPLMKEFPDRRLMIFMLEANLHMCRKADFKREMRVGWDPVYGKHFVIKMDVPWDETIISRFINWIRTTACNLKK